MIYIRVQTNIQTNIHFTIIWILNWQPIIYLLFAGVFIGQTTQVLIYHFAIGKVDYYLL